MDATPTVLWSTTPYAGYDINSVAVSRDGQVIAAGTFFHDYGAAQPSQPDAAMPEPEVAHEAERKIVERMSPAATRSDVSGNQDGHYGTYVWDRAGTLLFAKEFDGWQGVYWVDVAPEGRSVASCGWKSRTPYAGFVAAWTVPEGDALLSFALPARGNMVSLDGQGRTLLAGADQGYLFHRAGSAGFEAPACIALSATGDSVVATGIANDGATGLVASYQGEIILFRVTQGQPTDLARWQLPNAALTHYAVLSGDGRRAYVGANDGTLYAFEVADFLHSPGPAWQVAIPDGAQTIYGLACADHGGPVAIAGNLSQGGIVAVYDDARTHGTLRWTAQSQHSPNCLAFDPHGRWLALADGHPDGTPGAFYLWDARDGSRQWCWPTGNMSWPIRISGDASVMVGGSDDGAVTVFVGPCHATGQAHPGAR